MTESLLFQFPKIGEGPGQKTWIQIQNEPVKELKRLNLKLSASRRVRDDNGLTFLSISGNQQGGKSTYGMLILSEIFNNDKDEVLSHIVMSAAEFAKKISDALIGGYREKCIMWDDMSVEGSAMTYMTNPMLVKKLGALGDTLGVATKSIIFTSPSDDMTKAFRNYQKYKIQIVNGRGKYERIARGYWTHRSPMDQIICSREFEDLYDVRVPFYEEYSQKRRDISIKAALDMQGGNGEPKEDVPKKPTIKERFLELRRDYEAGVFGDITLKALCKANNINYQTAMNYI